jgi:hypothetical protein
MKKLTALLVFFTIPVMADNLQINLPYGIGSVQLPFQATEVGYGEFRPIKGGIWHQDLIASMPILTLGKLANGYRIVDGSLGAVVSIPSNGAVPDAYGALGHDLAQDLPFLKTFESLHVNTGLTYSNASGGWQWGGTISYAFWLPATPTTPQPTQPTTGSIDQLIHGPVVTPPTTSTTTITNP